MGLGLIKDHKAAIAHTASVGWCLDRVAGEVTSHSTRPSRGLQKSRASVRKGRRTRDLPVGRGTGQGLTCLGDAAQQRGGDSLGARTPRVP